MPRRSSIKTLPKPILAEVDRLLTEELATIDEVVTQLQALGYPRKRSAVGLYRQELEKVGEKIRRSQEISRALVKELGPAMAESKVGELLNQMLQSIVFDYLMGKAESDDAKAAMESQDFYFLGRALKEIQAAQKIAVDREVKIRKEFAAEAAEAAGAAAKKAGISDTARRKIEKEILGLVR